MELRISLRIQIEELEQKRQKLVNFMHRDFYSRLPAVEQGLIMVQLVAMENYRDALTRRLEFVEGYSGDPKECQ